MLVFHVIDEIWGSFSYWLFTYLQLACDVFGGCIHGADHI